MIFKRVSRTYSNLDYVIVRKTNIQLTDPEQPTTFKPRMISFARKTVTKHQELKRLEDNQIIEQISCSEWAAPF